MKFFVAILLCIFIPAQAGFFLDRDAAEEEQKVLDIDRGFSFGGGASAMYYLGAFDLSLGGVSAYRFQNDFGVSVDVEFGVSDAVHEAGVEMQIFLGENDFFGVGAGGTLFKEDGDWKRAPRIFVDYGRNMKPWRRAHFALQAKIRLAYLIGESLTREENLVTKRASTTVSGHLALIFF